MENIIESRNIYVWRDGTERLPALSESSSHFISCAMPIISEGDVIGCVASLSEGEKDKLRENLSVDIESKLVMTAAGFLGRQLES